MLLTFRRLTVHPDVIRCESEQRETERRQQCEGDDDGENTSSSSQELDDVGLREEKASSDSEVKVKSSYSPERWL